MGLTTNEFSAGMDRDSSKNKYDNRHYFDANNIRILTQDGMTSGALEDMAGTIERLDISNVNGTGGSIPVALVGHCILRDDIILFITENVAGPPDPAANNDYIVRVPISDIENLTGTNVKTLTAGYESAGGDWIYRNALGFSVDYPIQCVGRYENQYVQKIYWVDGYNRLRYLNTVHDDDTNDLTILPPDRLEVLGDFEINKPTLKDIGSGNLKSGRVQYAYQLYALNGGETVFSPVSNLINLVEYDDFNWSTASYKGSEIDVNTGKSVTCEIEVESDHYTRIRVVAIHYSVLNLEPEVRIVKEESIPGAGTYQFVDIGESLGSYTLSEIRLLQTTLFSAEVIETKDNILFAGNVVVEDFDIDYDARAYRFGGESSLPSDYNYNLQAGVQGVARVWESDLVDLYHIDGNTKTLTYYPTPGVPSILGDWSDMPEEADCINKFNDLDNDGDHLYRYMYQSDGATTGGEGPNVAYEIINDPTDRYIYDTSGGSYDVHEFKEGSAGNPSYEGYSSPWNAGAIMSFARDETYRVGIVFFDEKGRSSFVKWIGDIRMPSASTRFATIGPALHTYRPFTDGGLGECYMHPMYVEFTISNIPDTVSSFQIVRVKREGGDRSILSQGIAMPTENTSGVHNHIEWGATNTGGTTLQFHAPEVSFNKNLSSKGNDFLQVVGKTVTGSKTQDTTPVNYLIAYKYENWSILSSSETPTSAAISGDEFHADSFSDVTESLMVTQADIATNFGSGSVYFTNNATNATDKGIFCLIRRSGTLLNEGADWNGNIPVLNYRRNVFATQYGGNDYNARSISQYIPCSNVYDRNGVNDVVAESKGGDTFLGMFEFMWNARENEVALTTGVLPDVITYPCESSINLPLRLDDPYSKVYGNNDSIFIHDEAGIYGDGDISEGLANQVYFQYEDLYRYNTVYSKENDTTIFVPRPFDWRQLTDIDTRVYASDQKINGEQSDSWLRFRTDAFIEVDPQFGPLTVLETMGNQLLFFQPKAFGLLSVNERALIETGGTNAQLSLGTGGVLERYDYGKTNMGCSHWRHLLQTPNALYFVDVVNQAMFQHTKGPEEISIMRGMSNWFRENIVPAEDMSITIGDAMHLYYDPEYREVYLVDNTENWGLVYNEMTQSFVTFTDSQPVYAFNYLDRVLGTADLDQFHRHNDFSGARGHIYGSYRQINLTLLINPSVTDIGIFNNFEWLTECFDYDGIVLGDVDQPITWDSIRMWNDYQNTGTITLVVGDNVKRRMRKWRFTIPRSVYQRQGIAASDNRYARMRDTHMFAKFAYTNTEANRRFTIHDIQTSVTISNT